MNLRSSWVDETGQTREDTRLTQTGATTPANPVQVRSGIFPGSYDGRYRLAGFWTFGSAAMSVTVSEGRAVIQGDISQGAYPVTLPASEVVTFAPGHAQYSRKDLLVLKIYDRLYDTVEQNAAKIEIIQGEARQDPQPPPVPARCLPLYEVTVPAGASAGTGGIPWDRALKDLRTPVVSLGGIIPVEGPVLPGAYPGQYQDAGGALQRWDGGAWVSYPSAIGGIIPSSASGTTPASYTGQYRDHNGVLQRWDGSVWRPAYPGPYYTGSNDHGYTTSTTYTPTLLETGSSPLDVEFIAPPSGAILINYGARMWATSSTPHTVVMGLRLTQAGVTKIAESDETACFYTGTTPASMSSTTRFYNLTPGLPYVITGMFKCGTNTAQIRANYDNTFIMVHPQY
jgi:hypothetical protein